MATEPWSMFGPAIVRTVPPVIRMSIVLGSAWTVAARSSAASNAVMVDDVRRKLGLQRLFLRIIDRGWSREHEV